MSLICLSSIARLYCLCLWWLHCECLWPFCWFSSRFIQYRCCYVLCSYCMINYRLITRTMISSIPRERITLFIVTLWTSLVSIKHWNNSMLWVSKFLLLNAMMWVWVSSFISSCTTWWVIQARSYLLHSVRILVRSSQAVKMCVL